MLWRAANSRTRKRAVVVFATGIAHAQQRRGFFGRTASTLRVAAVPEVAKELEFTDQQTELAKELAAEQNNQRVVRLDSQESKAPFTSSGDE